MKKKKQLKHELRKAHKGMRRLSRRLMCAEGRLALATEAYRAKDWEWMHHVLSGTFDSRWRREAAAEKYVKHLHDQIHSR